MHKSTQHPGERLKTPACSCAEVALDTSEQLPPDTKQAFKQKTLEKRARAKFITNIVAFPLSKLRSPLEKAYKLTERCSGELTETPGKLVGLYCGCRWCLVCSRIRTARLITGYMPAIEQMAEKWFLTLSRPNVAGARLEEEIHYYLKTASLIQRHLREKCKLNYSSLRKIECTYNEEANTYHPHFHIIFDSQEAAQAFLDDWLARNPTAILNKGNHLVKADNSSVMELFKYFTKVVSKTKSKAKNGTNSPDYRIHLAALDQMFVAMRGIRTFQPCGVIKAVSEEIEPEQALESGRLEVNTWKWLNHDWVNADTAAALTGYVPAPGIQDIANHLVYPAGVPVAVDAAPDLTPFYVHKETGEVVPNALAHLVRGDFAFAKIYPLPAGQESTKKGACKLVPTPEDAVERQPIEVIPAPAPVASTQISQLSLWGALPTLSDNLPIPVKKAPLQRPAYRPASASVAPRPVKKVPFVAVSSDSLTYLNMF